MYNTTVAIQWPRVKFACDDTTALHVLRILYIQWAHFIFVFDESAKLRAMIGGSLGLATNQKYKVRIYLVITNVIVSKCFDNTGRKCNSTYRIHSTLETYRE